MEKIFVATALAAAFVLAGCQTAATVRPSFPTDPNEALAKAQADVKAAAAKDALWTTAQVALKKAKEAAKTGDSAEVVKFAEVASDQANLGLAQTRYPLTH
ncbi:MAG TPA: hypothetical protein VNF69_09630 [Burkholderiales bacterium]|nr:hypothetical protein [Burkholderiales bacterium]